MFNKFIKKSVIGISNSINSFKLKKKLILTFGFCFLIFLGNCKIGFSEVAIPSRPTGYISDYAHLLNSSDKSLITRYALELEKKTTAQIAVVTFDSTKPESIQGFSVRLFDQWKIGHKGKDNGVLILIAVKDREAWITTGYGMEGAIPDVIANNLVKTVMVPYFKRGDFSSGIKALSVDVISLMAKEYNVVITGKEEQVYQQVRRKKSPFEILFLIIMFILVFGSRSGLLQYFIFGSLLGGRRRGGHWYGSGYSGSSGGFGGGFGGFGGGLTGGGGGGGSW